MVVGPKVTLRLETVTETISGTGITESWSMVKSFRGTLYNLSANERFANGKEAVYATHRFVSNEQPTISPDEKYRFTLGTRTFDIVHFNNLMEHGRNWEFDLLEIV